MIRQLSRAPARVGVAIDPHQMVAVVGTRERGSRPAVWTRELELGTDRDSMERELTVALSELGEQVGPRRGRLHIKLLPPLARLRRIELPRARQDEIRQIIAGAPTRYFLEARAPQTVAVTTAPGALRSPVTYQVTAADEGLVEAVFSAAATSGWRVGSIGTAYETWERAGLLRWPGLRSGRAALLVPRENLIEAMIFENGLLHQSRRFPPRSDPERLLVELGTSRVAFLGSDEECGHLAYGFSAAGGELLVPIGQEAPRLPAVVVAAQFAVRGAEPALLPAYIRRARVRQAARITRWLYLGAAALVVLAAGLELWGARRELTFVKARRVGHQEQVLRAMELRDGIAAVESRIRTLALAAGEASRWTPTLAAVSLHLPRDAHLAAFYGTGDSLRLEGLARRAAGVFESIQRTPEIGTIRPDAPIRQEAQDSGPPIEHFSLAARLARQVEAAP